MGESRKKKERRRDSIKPTAKLPPFPPPVDEAVSNEQRSFCKALIGTILDDDKSLSFSKPVDELWDRAVLGDYFEKIKQPMDLGTIRSNLNSNGYAHSDSGLFDANAFREKLRLVFLNSIEYNAKGTELARLATKFIIFVDSELASLPGQRPPEEQQPQNKNQKHEKSHSPDKIPATSEKASAPKLDRPAKSEKSEKIKPKPKHEDTSDLRSEDQDDAKDEEMEDAQMKDEDLSELDEHEKLTRQISSMQKHRARCEATLAEIELMRNVPLTYEENSKLRDEVEALPWDKAQKVVQILRSYVDAALTEAPEPDPEFVTLEFSTVEPRLLRDIEELIRPNPRIDKEKRAIANLNEEIDLVQRKLRKLPEREHSSRKKQRRRR